MNKTIKRRTFLSALASGVAVTACTPVSNMSTNAKSGDGRLKQQRVSFLHGVASGDPQSDDLVIWTRITPDFQLAEDHSTSESFKSAKLDLTVQWQLSKQSDFSNILQSGEVITGQNKDYTVKVLVSDLQAGATYFYRFQAGSTLSPIGRTKTLPSGSLEQLGIALVSCSNYPFGYFNVYAAIAKDDAIDFVLHTGDYIYEYAADGWGGETGKSIGRMHQPTHETVTLSDYRTRHAQYKTDEGSQEMHSAHPLICIWDDHESANNPWMGGAQNHQSETEGSWQNRRTAAVKAYYEWMPIRDKAEGESPLNISKQYSFADLATLVTLESRHTGRVEQIDYLKNLDKLQTPESAHAFLKNVVGAKNRPMLSESTEALITLSIEQSIEKKHPWRLLGNACPIARMPVPNILALETLRDASEQQMQTDRAKYLTLAGALGLPQYLDTWDGYPWARERLYQQCQEAGAQDMVFLTGDSHSFWLNQLKDDQAQPMGIELGTSGITSPGDFLESGWDSTTAARLDQVYAEQIDEVEWTDNMHKGYVRVVMTHEQMQADFVTVSTVLNKDYRSKVIKQARIAHTQKVTEGVPKIEII